MSSVPIDKRLDFERWLINAYPKLFSEWELEASEYMDVDDWIEENYYAILKEWRKRKAGK